MATTEVSTGVTSFDQTSRISCALAARIAIQDTTGRIQLGDIKSRQLDAATGMPGMGDSGPLPCETAAAAPWAIEQVEREMLKLPATSS